jgi:hypothetical protein
MVLSSIVRSLILIFLLTKILTSLFIIHHPRTWRWPKFLFLMDNAELRYLLRKSIMVKDMGGNLCHKTLCATKLKRSVIQTRHKTASSIWKLIFTQKISNSGSYRLVVIMDSSSSHNL